MTHRWPAAILLGILAHVALGCGARSRDRSAPARSTYHETYIDVEDGAGASARLPPDVPGDGYVITLGVAGTVVLELPSGAEFYGVLGPNCETLSTGRAPAMGGRVTIPAGGVRAVAVTMDERLFAADLPHVPPSAGLTISMTYAAFSGGDHVYGDFAQSCRSALSRWAADPTGERATPEAAAAATALEDDADGVANAEIAAGACNSESSRMIDAADSGLDTLLQSAHLVRVHRERAVGASADVLRGLTAPAAGTYHVLVGSWRPVELAVVGRDGPLGTESPFARLLASRGWTAAGRTFTMEEGGRFGLRISTRGCLAVYVYYELPR